MAYEWDPAKSRTNLKKHGISFEDAVEVFADEEAALELFDEEHSVGEERFTTIGPTRHGLVLVSWTERGDDAIRIISARRATPRERRLFADYMRQQT